MSRYGLFLLICMIGSSLNVFSCDALNAGGTPPFLHQGEHTAKINAADTLTLVADGQANVEIVVMTPAPLLRFAAEELQAFIEKATGVKIDIVRQRTGTIPAIVLGDNLWTRQAAGIDVGTLPRDGFRIRRIADVIYIAGRDDAFADPKRLLVKSVPNFEMGTLFGVYDFLERFLGVRFYFPGDIGTVVPKTDTLRIPMVDIYEVPDFLLRAVSYYGPHWDEKADVKAVRWHNNLARLRWRGETCYIPNCHSMARCGISQRFAETNPEYFALLPNGKRDSDLSLPGHPGQHCFSSKGLENEVYKDAVAFLTGQPPTVRNVTNRSGISVWDGSAFRPGYFNIMPNDGYGPGNYCRCKECWPYLGQNRASELIWGFVCRIAARLKQDGIPGYVTGMVYSGYREVPPFDIPGNVLVQVATMGPWKDKYPEFQAADDQLLIDWTKKIKKKVWTWNYINAYGNKIPSGVPAISTQCIGSYLKRMAPYLFGAHLQSDTDYPLFHYLNYYVIHKVCWRNDTDVDALVAEHHQKMFGPAAGPMGEFFARLEAIWMTELLGEFKSTPLGPTMVKRTDADVWEQVYTDDTLGELEGLFVEAEKLCAADPDSLRRVKWFREHFFGWMLRVKNEYRSKKRELEDLVWQITPAPEEEKISLDGNLDDAAWSEATSVTLVPINGEDPLVKTTVSGLWMPDALYLAYDCRETKIGNLRIPDREPDERDASQDPSVEFFLLPSSDDTTYFRFVVTANGSVGDAKVNFGSGGMKQHDWNWDSSVEAAAVIGETGWTVEIAVPMQQIVADGVKNGDCLVANVGRGRNLVDVETEENQFYSWSPFVRGSFQDTRRFGRIVLVDKPQASTSLVSNGSFEAADKRSPAAGWHFPREPEERELVTIDESTYRDGSRCLRFSDAKTRLLITQYLPPLKPNTRYLLTYFVKLKDVQRRPEVQRYGACANVMVHPADGQNLFLPTVLFKGTMPWTKQGFIFTSGPNAGKGFRSYLRLYLYGTKGTAWFDDVRLRELAD